MTNKNKAFFRRFIELTIKSTICRLWLAIQIKQKKSDQTTIEKVAKVTQSLKDLESKISDIIVNNKALFESVNLNDISKYQADWITPEKQKLFARELLGYEITLEELIEQAKN